MEISSTKILKIESGTLKIFGNFGNLKKIESGILKLETFGNGHLKKYKSRIFKILETFGNRHLKKLNSKFLKFWKFRKWTLKKIKSGLLRI